MSYITARVLELERESEADSIDQADADMLAAWYAWDANDDGDETCDE